MTKYLSLISQSFMFSLWFAGMVKSTVQQVLFFFFFLFILLIIIRSGILELGNLKITANFLCLILQEWGILVCACAIW